ncbi:MAG TPA: zinc-ribbon and DUF3426 domain-containing protein [Rudaea sp.]|nr:zinc-ribbon and DUF3426 domain-containing protein [Rudaea sp.]
MVSDKLCAMYTQCPECLTIYKVAVNVLADGRGSVRCGHCAAVFDTLCTLTEHLPPEPVQHLLTHPDGGPLPQLSVPALRPNPSAQQSLLFDPDERPRHVTPRRSPPTPAFARTRVRHIQPSVRNWPWALGVVVLATCLLAQAGYAKRAQLLDNANLRPWLDEICGTIGCTLPLRHDPTHLELLSRDIRPHPSVPGALIISATLRNDGSFAQAFPAVEITLSDLDENRIAMRRFLPREYLPNPHSLSSGLAPGATAALVFEVADPGKNAVAFEFKFL